MSKKASKNNTTVEVEVEVPNANIPASHQLSGEFRGLFGGEMGLSNDYGRWELTYIPRTENVTKPTQNLFYVLVPKS